MLNASASRKKRSFAEISHGFAASDLADFEPLTKVFGKDGSAFSSFASPLTQEPDFMDTDTQACEIHGKRRFSSLGFEQDEDERPSKMMNLSEKTPWDFKSSKEKGEKRKRELENEPCTQKRKFLELPQAKNWPLEVGWYHELDTRLSVFSYYNINNKRLGQLHCERFLRQQQ